MQQYYELKEVIIRNEYYIYEFLSKTNIRYSNSNILIVKYLILIGHCLALK